MALRTSAGILQLHRRRVGTELSVELEAGSWCLAFPTISRLAATLILEAGEMKGILGYSRQLRRGRTAAGRRDSAAERLITAVYPLADAQRAFDELLGRAGARQLKVLLSPSLLPRNTP
jgi:hypothetical protein